MQNKPNLLAVSKTPKMNITSATTVNYINELRTKNYELIMKNKPNSNPIQTQSKPVLSAVLSMSKGAACPEHGRMGRMGQFAKSQDEIKLLFNSSL